MTSAMIVFALETFLALSRKIWYDRKSVFSLKIFFEYQNDLTEGYVVYG